MLLLAPVFLGLQKASVVGEAAALLTILVDIAGFNAAEGHTPVLVLIALLMISIVTGTRSMHQTRRSGAATSQPPAHR
jgi:hypothetical protein